ncbi:MBL fold metallo-hydrolase [Bacillus atrophaeus]|uniref:MBL fold metallo-hydrolase n=1 Tax=Bacillus atrophaeus TaxID=1452 RepID=UPI00227DD126|nr:MBL fold metallo-hydrolase [Bacillus atrophaeus]MCY9136814.1 MBL fold metallo-hydrolase [Bacillus atrophaeus]
MKIKLQEFYHFIYNEQELMLTDVSYTLNCRRDHNKYRLAIIASNKEELMKKLYECLTELLKENENFQLKDTFLNNICDKKYGQIESEINPLNHDLQNICKQYIQGKNINWHRIYQYDCQVVSLPVYPFKKTRCWYNEEKRNYVLKDDIVLNDNEKIIVDAWAKIFGVKEIDLKQDIYEVGGDSLSLVSMYHEIKNKLPDIVLESFIQNESLREILDYVNQNAKTCVEIDELIYETDEYKIFKFSNGVNTSNTYLINSDEQTILIDSGVSIKYLTQFCEKEKIKGINHIIFTHSHFDHTYSAQEIKEKFKCNFVMHEKELNFAKDLVNNGLALMGKSFLFEKSDILLKENKMMKLKGLEVLPILCPGHTSGSICIKIDEFLFTGDTMFKDENSGVDKKTGNGELLRRSISYLLNNMNENTIVCPGHGETCSIKYIKNRYKINTTI